MGTVVGDWWFGGAAAGMMGTKVGNGGVTPNRHRHSSESVER